MTGILADFGSAFSRAGQSTPSSNTPGVLRTHKLAAPPNAHDLVFASQAGTPIDPDNVYRAWTRSLRKAGLRHVELHSTRRSAVAMLVAAGANPKQIQVMVGHGSIQLTMDTYGHLFPDSFDELKKALDEMDIEPARRPTETANG